MMKKKSMCTFLIIGLCACLVVFLGISYKNFLVKKNTKKFFNIVLIGAAGSGKGTQGELLTKQFNLLQVSAGDVLRAHRKDPKGKYTKQINEYIDKGQLVPTKITNGVISQHIKKHVFCKDCKYNGIIFDGYPREKHQLDWLTKFLKKHNNKVDAVVYIDVALEELVDRLSGRFMCSQCGALYHKKSKPTKVEGVCDKCGSKHFVVRGDDQSADAIKQRFTIFENQTKIVLEEYNKQGIVIKVDGSKGPKEVNDEIVEKLKPFQQNNSN